MKRFIRSITPILVTIVYVAVALSLEEVSRRLTDSKAFVIVAFYVVPVVAVFFLAWREGKAPAGAMACAQCGGEAKMDVRTCPSCGVSLPAVSPKTGRSIGEYIVWAITALLWGGILFIVTITRFYSCCSPTVSACADVKSALSLYAVEEEAYFTDHDQYTTAVSGEGMPGFKPNKEVMLIHKAGSPTTEGFTVTGTHPRCDYDMDGSPDIYTWDSSRGGLQQ